MHVHLFNLTRLAISMFAALSLLTLNKAPDDSRALYNEIQDRVKSAAAIKYEFDTGPDAWDTFVTVTIEPGNRYSERMKNIRTDCDGKWFLHFDTGDVIHRPAKPTDIYYVKGLESFYSGKARLDIFGEVKVETKYPAWVISYRSGDENGTLSINPETRLPYGVTLLSETQIETVPGQRNQSEIAAAVSQSLKDVKTILLKRITKFRNYPTKNVTEHIYIRRNGKAWIEPDTVPSSFRFDRGKNLITSQKKFRWVSAPSLGLRGMESLTGAPKKKYSGTSLLTYPNLDSSRTFTWVLKASDRTTRLDTQTFIDLDNNLPVGYDALNREGRIVKSVEYYVIAINPTISTK